MSQIHFIPTRPHLPRRVRWIVGSAVVCGLLVTPAAAQNDFELLLNELTFGQAESPSDESPPEEVPLSDEPVTDPLALQDADDDAELTGPEGPPDSEPPIDSPVLVPESETEAPAAEAPATDAPAEPLQAAEPLQLSDPPTVPEPVQEAPSDAPEAESPPAAVDFHQVFSEPGAYASDAVLGHSHDVHHSASYGLPRQAPVLPPPSSLLGYFRSQPCHSAVWAGYEYDRHAHCEHYHAHLHGRCKCFESRSKHSPELHSATASGCSKCGQHHCDRRH